MENSDNKKPVSTSANIVTIAYCQSKLLAGDDDECKDSTNEKQQRNFEFVNRIKNIPLMVGIATTVSEAYNSLKTSHNTAESILNTTEEQLSEAIKILSPVTNKIGDILDEPLQSIDKAVCDGFDYLSEKVPQFKSESEKVYKNIGEYIKIASNSAITYSSSVATTINEKLKNDKDK